jgi:ribosomal protein L21E
MNPRSTLIGLMLAAGCPLTSFAETQPLFPNSVVSNDLDFIKTDDPSVAFTLKQSGVAKKEMPGAEDGGLMVDGVITFLLKYDDGAEVAIWTAPSVGDAEASARYVRLVGAALGKQPAAMRRKLSHVVIHGGDRTAFAEDLGHFFVIYSANIDRRVSTHDLEETVFHETVHATLEAEHAKHPDWTAAQGKDLGFITQYAADKPQKEDLPESALFAYTLHKHPGRLPAEIETKVREIMPNRLKYLEKLFQKFEG